MEPDEAEMEDLAEALELIQEPDQLDEAQIHFLIEFFENYAEAFDEDAAQEVFEDKESIFEACQVIHDYVQKYADDSELMHEFRNTAELTIKILQNGDELNF